MRLVSLIWSMGAVCLTRAGCASRELRDGEEPETAGDDERRERARYLHAAPVARRRFTDPAREQGGETAEAREADLHADIGDRRAGREQGLRACEPRVRPVLMRRGAVDRCEL